MPVNQSNPINPATYAALIIPSLTGCDGKRLEKAILGLADDSLQVDITHHTESEIRALVKNGDKVAYPVVLSCEGAECNCADYEYRQSICKHILSVALWASRPPEKPAPQFPTHHLRFRDSGLLCGADSTEPSWTWPWSLPMLRWPEVCKKCVEVQRAGYNRRTETWKASEVTARRAGGSFVRGGSVQKPHLMNQRAA
jgi:hypothetical protein